MHWHYITYTCLLYTVCIIESYTNIGIYYNKTCFQFQGISNLFFRNKPQEDIYCDMGPLSPPIPPTRPLHPILDARAGASIDELGAIQSVANPCYGLRAKAPRNDIDPIPEETENDDALLVVNDCYNSVIGVSGEDSELNTGVNVNGDRGETSVIYDASAEMVIMENAVYGSIDELDTV